MNKKVLIVDDEPNILELLEFNLKKEGYEVHRADTGEKAVSMLDTHRFDIVLLDQMLPGIDGLGVLKKIRLDSKLTDMPVIMVTARAEEIDRIIGLELGADDYITKPFSMRELCARVKALLRRTRGAEAPMPEILTYKQLEVNTLCFKADLAGEPLGLTLKEFELLVLLITHKTQVLTRDVILNKVWGYDYFGETRTVDVHITNLRRKLGGYGDLIETVRGVGYRFNTQNE